MIYFFSPYNPLGLGHAYNSHCLLVPEDSDWICLMDLDTMYFSSQRIGEHLEEVIAKFHPQFSAFTCVTNRAYGTSQQQLLYIREERDLVKLKERADRQLVKRKGRVDLLRTALNGHMMLFPKWLWKAFPFAAKGAARRIPGHHILGIDTDFHQRTLAAGHKWGLIHSLMAVHFYRLDGPSAVMRASFKPPGGGG